MSNARLKYTVKGATATEREVAIVIDILRASTVITTALCYDAKWIAPTLEIESAFELAKKYKALLVGERKCLKINGFDFGNSPTEITEDKVRGKKIIFTSTNFPRVFLRAKNSPVILVGSILNVSAVTVLACRLAVAKGYDICFMLAGTSGNSADEDLAFVGTAGTMLENCNSISMDTEVKNSINFVARKGIEKCIRDSFHAKRLINLGFEDDVEFASRKDIFNIIPIAKDNKIVKLSNPTDTYGNGS